MLWKSYIEINNIIVPDTFEREALKVDLIFNFIVLIFLIPPSLYLNIKSARIFKFSTLFVITCLVIVFILYSNQVSSLVGGIL